MQKKLNLKNDEEICPLCNGWNLATKCSICNLRGKIDWIDKITKVDLINNTKMIRMILKKGDHE